MRSIENIFIYLFPSYRLGCSLSYFLTSYAESYKSFIFYIHKGSIEFVNILARH